VLERDPRVIVLGVADLADTLDGDTTGGLPLP
jgi:hypothetical protein